MKKIALIILIAAATLFLVAPDQAEHIVNTAKKEVLGITSPLVSREGAKVKKTAKKQTEKATRSLATAVTNEIKSIVSSTAQSTNTALEQKTQEVLGAVFQTTGTIAAVVVTPVKKSDAESTFVIDFLKDINKSFKFEKNKRHIIAFKNLPENYCLYINGSKYELSADNMISITFSVQGTYSMRFDYCSNSGKFGDIVVE